MTLLLCDALSPNERAAVEAHLEQCPNCARELRALRLTRETLASLPASPTPDRVRANVRAALLHPPRRRFAWPLVWPLPFALGAPTRQLAWGGALAVSAIGLMLLARPLQHSSSSNTPASESAPLQSAGKTVGASAQKPVAVSSAPAKSTPAKTAPVANGSNSNALFSDGHAKWVRPKGTAKLPQPAKIEGVAPQRAPRVAPPGAVAAPSDAFSNGTASTAKTRNKIGPATEKSSAAKSPPAQPSAVEPARATARARPKLAAPAPKTNVLKPPLTAPASPSAPAAVPSGAASLAKSSGPTSAGLAGSSGEPPARVAGNQKQSAAPSAIARADGAFQMRLAQTWTGGAVTATLTRGALAGDGVARLGVGEPNSRGTSENAPAAAPASAAPLKGPPPPAPVTAMRGGASVAVVDAPVTLTLRAVRSVGAARLLLLAPDRETEIWRGTLGTAPVEIPLQNPVLQQLSPKSGQKIRARLEQINGQGESAQSLPLELTWP